MRSRFGGADVSFYRCEFKIHGRSGGSRSAVAAAAYRSALRLSEREPPATDALAAAAYRAGQSLGSEAHGAVHDFARKRGVVHSEILLPNGAPDWMADRQRL